ncbi:hypothetical protein MPSEU_000278100 [Mayamaea pseudoterrestris]|nr:hypothetical protein MPSEU_000278100 [Mayamaea pseudoterrestris]
MLGRLACQNLHPKHGSFTRLIRKTYLPRHITGGGKTPESQELHRLFEEQMMELKAERELLFGYTLEEHEAWGKAGNHRHAPSFLDEVKLARETQFGQRMTLEDDFGAAVGNTTEPSRQSGTSPPLVPKNSGLSHVSSDGQSIQMVNVAGKQTTQRVAVAQSRVVFPPEVSSAFRSYGYDSQPNELTGPKGPIFQCAKLAGIMAAKKTSDLIPLCHPLPLDFVDIQIELIDSSVAVIRCECRVTHKTGVEMEALTGASIAALTIYDMTKALSHRIRIEDTVLLSKTGGTRTVSTDNDILE